MKGKRHFLIITITSLISTFLLWGSFSSAISAKTSWRVHDDILTLSFPTENDGWASGRWGTILHTTDGGATWRKQDSGTRYTLVAIHFPDTQNGWAVGVKGTIVHTSDAGRTWKKQQSPVDFYHMGVFFLNEK